MRAFTPPPAARRVCRAGASRTARRRGESEPVARVGRPPAGGPSPNVTRPGAVTVVLWEDGYEGGVNGHPLALTLDAGAVDAASIAAAEDAAASVATNQLGAGVEPYAALLDEVTHDPVADATVAAPCCAPNRTWHLRAPASASAPAILYTTRNGTHEWDPGSYPPNLPRVLLALELGREDGDELNSGFTLERSNALRDAVADAARARVADVVPKVTEPGKLSLIGGRRACWWSGTRRATSTRISPPG